MPNDWQCIAARQTTAGQGGYSLADRSLAHWIAVNSPNEIFTSRLNGIFPFNVSTIRRFFFNTSGGSCRTQCCAQVMSSSIRWACLERAAPNSLSPVWEWADVTHTVKINVNIKNFIKSGPWNVRQSRQSKCYNMVDTHQPRRLAVLLFLWLPCW